jgi:hypothetical protein
MNIKTDELTDRALNWAVAHSLGLLDQELRYPNGAMTKSVVMDEVGDLFDMRSGAMPMYEPSSNDAHGGPIIDLIGIDTHQIRTRPFSLLDPYHYDASKGDVVEYVPACKREMVKRPNPPSKYEGVWFARLSVDHGPFGWQLTHFPSQTRLQAAMRCAVASVSGNEIEVPAFLLKIQRSERTRPAARSN